MALTFPVPNYRVGPYQGFRSTGRIDATEMTLSGDMEVTGTLTANFQVGATTTTGHLTADMIVDAGVDITAATGAVIFNYASSTGAFTTSTGTNTMSGDVVVTAGKKLTHGAEVHRALTKVAGYTITDTDPDLVFLGGAGTIILPTAADNTGRSVKVITTTATATVLDGEGAETINGVASKTCSTQYSVIEVMCDGAAWYITDTLGTWT